MTARQFTIVPEAEKFREELVRLLRDLVGEAERGEIDGIFGVVTKPNGDKNTVCSASLSVTQKMGCLFSVMVDLHNARD